MDDSERARLQSLRRYGLDRAGRLADPDLDLAARLLRQVTGATAAAVHIVEASQQLRVAAAGVELEVGPREESLCAVAMHTTAPGTVFQSVEASTDERFGPPDPGLSGLLGFYASAPLLDPEGQPLGTVCVWDAPGSGRQALDPPQQQAVLDLADFVMRVLSLRRRALELEHDALHDPLTLLPNRRLLLDRLHQALTRRQRVDGEPLVAMVDLVGFKAVNDEHGHAAGDTVLRAVAERLLDVLRPEDTVARWGGDEFVVVAEQLPASVEAVLARLRGAFDLPFETAVGLQVQLGVTVGWSLGSGDESAESLIGRADAEMYALRRRERG